jgi:hypothetical protein
LGAQWLGWDVANGAHVDHPPHLNDLLLEATKTPRKYGFHGTIKPPFHLAEGTDFENLRTQAHLLCESLAPVQIEAFSVAKIGSFVALIPEGDLSPLANLAAQILQKLDGFRAPASADELARRRRANLTPLQETNLKNWGYPYVLEDFKFHMTLSGKLNSTDADALFAAAQGWFAPALGKPLLLRSLTLVGEAGDGRFHTLHRFPLGAK